MSKDVKGNVVSIGGVYEAHCSECSASQVFTSPARPGMIAAVLHTLGWRRKTRSRSLHCPECAGVDVAGSSFVLKFPRESPKPKDSQK